MKFRALFRTSLSVFCFTVLASALHAHPGHDGGHDLTWDFTNGLGHPLAGWDHLLAMLAVGLWAAQLGGRARWAVPMTFLGTMALGAMLGFGNTGFSWFEQLIALSVLVLGLCVSFARRLTLGESMAIVASFSLIHGFAHGAEIPKTADAVTYAAGFLCATAALLSLGLALGLGAQKFPRSVLRTSGVLIAGIGSWMLIA
jgi:urease accessory protein